MSEFVEVMKAWRRMCGAESTCDSCKLCPAKDNDACVGIWEADMDKLPGLEEQIMKWDREHPKIDTIREALKMCLRRGDCRGLCPYDGKEDCRNRLLTDVLKVIGND